MRRIIMAAMFMAALSCSVQVSAQSTKTAQPAAKAQVAKGCCSAKGAKKATCPKAQAAACAKANAATCAKAKGACAKAGKACCKAKGAAQAQCGKAKKQCTKCPKAAKAKK